MELLWLLPMFIKRRYSFFSIKNARKAMKKMRAHLFFFAFSFILRTFVKHFLSKTNTKKLL
jgi:hypothetical protein